VPERRARRWSTLITATGIVLVAVGGWWWTQDSGQREPTASAAARGALRAQPPRAALVTAGRTPSTPRRLRIPALGVSSAVVAVRAPRGTLVPPSDPSVLGWWAGGAEPGSAAGRVLIAGHTVHDGPGALNHLDRLRKGDPLLLTTRRATLRYVTVSVRRYRKGTLAADAPRLFSRHGAPRLVVVTCTDWDGERYLSNTVVTARPVP
jgi:LPXTG-site transpeptidase (sortase) family protein